MTEIQDFAQKVERMCEFLLSNLYDESGRNGSKEQKFLEDLKEEAADIQKTPPGIATTLHGLTEFVGGLPPKTEES